MAVAYQSTQTGATTGKTLTITKPASLAVGDLMIAQITREGGDSGTEPSGFTSIRSDSITALGDLKVTLFKKIADSGDVAASNFSFTSDNNNGLVGAISRFTGADQTTPITTSNGQVGAATTSIVSPGVTPLLPGSMIVLFTANGFGTQTISAQTIATNPPTFTERYDTGLNDGIGIISVSMATGTRPETTATGNGTATSSASKAYAAELVVISPVLSYTLTMAQGSFTYTGVAATIGKLKSMVAQMGSYSLTSIIAVLSKLIWSNPTKHTASASDVTKHTVTPSNVSKHNASPSNTQKS